MIYANGLNNGQAIPIILAPSVSMTVSTPQSLPVASPCIKVCVLDAQQICTGCGRSLDEIARWSQMAPAQQRQVVALAARRREQRSG